MVRNLEQTNNITIITLAKFLARVCDTNEEILNAGRSVNSVFGDAAFYFVKNRKMVFRCRFYSWWRRNTDNIREKTTEYRRILHSSTEEEKCFSSNPAEQQANTLKARLDSPTHQSTINDARVENNITNGSEEKNQEKKERKIAKISLAKSATKTVKKETKERENSPCITQNRSKRKKETKERESSPCITQNSSKRKEKKNQHGNTMPKLIKIGKRDHRVLDKSVSTKPPDLQYQLEERKTILHDISMNCDTEEVINDSSLRSEVTNPRPESFDTNGIQQVYKVVPSTLKKNSTDENHERLLQDKSTSTDINCQNGCYCSIGPVSSCSSISPCAGNVLENYCQDPASVHFGNFVAEEISVLEDKQLFFKTKHRIQNILMEAQNEQMKIFQNNGLNL